MKIFVIELLTNNIPFNYVFHNVRHTLYVCERAIEIGQMEGCTAAEIRLLEAAALFHDTGYIHTREGHEMESCKLATRYLPPFGYQPDEIQEINEIIMATKIPQEPRNKLGEILADADVEYLGTEQAAKWTGALFKELCSLRPAFTERDWVEVQISFMEKHHYFTDFCKKNRDHLKQKYLELLVSSLSG